MEGVGFETTSTSTSSGGGGGGEHDDKSTIVPLPTLDVVKTTKINSTTMTSSSSSIKKSGANGGRRSVQKRVVSVPIAEVDGSRPKGAGEGAPPSDSWAWRKYGQKPIKGSPYPRGYYRCSSSKGCPARKQVERSRVDPTMLVVTYAAEHNHSWPLPKSHNHQSHHHHHNNRHQNRHSGQIPRLPPRISTQFRPPREPEGEGDEDEEEEEEEEEEVEMEEEEYQAPSPTPATTTTTNTSTSSLEDTNTTAATFASDLGEDSSHMMLMAEDLGWHSYMSEVSLPSEAAMMVPVSYDEVSKDLGFGSGGGGGGGGEEEESLFAGLGELPECSAVFRRGFSVGAS